MDESLNDNKLERIDASMVKRLAEQTTLNLFPGWVNHGRGLLNLIAFAKAVASFEREMCAKTCEEKHANGNWKYDTRYECAEAIRERSKTHL